MTTTIPGEPWSTGVARTVDGAVTVAGVDVRELAVEHGTPAYVLDEADLRTRARGYRRAFETAFAEIGAGVDVYYAGKAFLSVAVARWVHEEGLRVDTATGGELAEVRFKPSLCDGEPMQPEHARLDENALVQFLTKQHLDVTLDRPRADLVYLNINGAGTEAPVRMRVAILDTPDLAGAELHEALLQHGEGAWGVHRSNLAALVAFGNYADSIAFAGKTKLACWGVFTAAGRDDTFVVPGGYLEL